MKSKIITKAALALLLLAGGMGMVACRHKDSTVESPAKQAAQADLTKGFWEGTLEVPQHSLRLVLQFTNTPAGLQGLLDSVDQGGSGISTACEFKSPSLVVAFANIGGKYTATLNPEGSELKGTWNQGGDLPLTLKHVDKSTMSAPKLTEADLAPKPGSDLQGRWLADFELGGQKLRAVFNISEPSPGVFVATGDSPFQGVRGIPISQVKYSKPSVRIEIDPLSAVVQGDLNDAGEIVGTLTQRETTAPVTLRRYDAASDPTKSMIAKNSAPNDPAGYWAGTLDTGRGKLRLQIKLGKTPDGNWMGLMNSLDQGAKDIVSTGAAISGEDVRVEWDGLKAVLKAKITNNHMEGAWMQGAGALPLLLDRTKEF